MKKRSLCLMGRLLIPFLASCFLYSPSLFAKQESKLIFEEEVDRFTFAQMHLGYELNVYDLTLPTTEKGDQERAEIHNIIFGGWHFWGMADFYVSFPYQTYEKNGATFTPGVETAFRWYPTPITNNKFRPFLGVGFNFSRYQQSASSPLKTTINYPLNVGLSIANQSFQLETGIRYQPSSEFNYYTSTSQQRTFSTGETSYFIALKRVVDTTMLSKPFANIRQKQGFYPFIGAGPSAAWISNGENSYFKERAPWIDNDVSVKTFPEFSVGFHWKNNNLLSQRTIFNVAIRNFNYRLQGYNSNYKLTYQGLSFEAAQSLFDYNGFVPFLGLSYNVVDLGISGDAVGSKKESIVGALVGWDIMPIGSRAPWVLRTNLRWYPKIELTTEENSTIAFPNFEFNVIQWIYQF